MALSFDNIFGKHEAALLLRSQRTRVLAENLANADTPNYKARDIDFKQAMANFDRQSHSKLDVTNDRHITINDGTRFGAELRFRVPLQASIDGNTVDTQVEHAAYMKNAMAYQASLRFLSGRVQGMMSAIRGD